MMRAVDEPVLTPWRPWETIPVALAALCASILVAVIAAAAGLGAGWTALLITSIAMQASFLGFSVGWVAIRYRQGLGALGLRSSRGLRDLAVGAWFGAALFMVTIGLLAGIIALWTALAGGPPPPIEQPILPPDPAPVHVVLGMFAVVVAAPLGEEVLFRGFLFGSLRGRVGFVAAAAISAGAFALFHVTPLLVVVMVFVGFALAWLYEWRGSVIAPIGAHAMFNVIGYTLLLLERT